MKLSTSVLATMLVAPLCALGTTGCEPIYMAPPVAPTQSAEMVPVDPRIETIEGVEFAQPPPGEPVRIVPPRRVIQPIPPPPPPQHTTHSCPACGMG